MQQEILQVYQQYPWASEVTMSTLSNSMKKTVSHTKIASVIQASFLSSAAKQQMIDALDSENASDENLSTSTTDMWKNLTNVSESIVANNVNGMEALADLQEQMVKAGEELELGGKINTLIDAIGRRTGRYGRGLARLGKKATSGAGMAAAMSAGVGIFVARLISSQGKLIMNMIELGLASDSMRNLDKLRQDSALLGLGFDKYAKVLQISADLATTSNKDAVTGAVEFGQFVRKYVNDESVNKFGLKTGQFTEAIAITADALYRSNQITSLNPQAQEKIINVFTTNQQIALGLAEATGRNRSTMLDELERQRGNQERNLSMTQNSEEYIKMFGEQAFLNLDESADALLALIANDFGSDSELYRQMESTINASVFNIKYDQTAINDITPEFAQLLMEIGGGTESMVVDMLDRMLRGEIDKQDMAVRYSELVKKVDERGREAKRRGPNADPISESAKDVMNVAITVNETVKNITPERLQEIIDSVDENVEVAGESVEVIDEFQKAYLTTLEAFTPTISNMDAVMDLFYGVGDFVLKVSRYFGLSSSHSDAVEKMREEAKAIPQDVIVYDVGTSEYNNQPVEMRISPNGPITGNSIATYLAMRRSMLSNDSINESSNEDLTERKRALAELTEELQEEADDATDETILEQLRQRMRIIEAQTTRISQKIAEREQEGAM